MYCLLCEFVCSIGSLGDLAALFVPPLHSFARPCNPHVLTYSMFTYPRLHKLCKCASSRRDTSVPFDGKLYLYIINMIGLLSCSWVLHPYLIFQANIMLLLNQFVVVLGMPHVNQPFVHMMCTFFSSLLTTYILFNPIPTKPQK